MKSITIEVTKVIVVTVEAEDYASAVDDLESDFSDGGYEGCWANAEPEFKLLYTSEWDVT